MFSAEARQRKYLRRQKREWIMPPAKLRENTDYMNREFIAKIRSDKSLTDPVEYYLSGKGADRPPFNLFVVDQKTGFVKITGVLDREKCPSYHLTGVAKFTNGTTAEADIPLTVIVVDENDNPPTFELYAGNVSESSSKGTFIMQISAKDKDQAGTINSNISYSIVSQEPAGTGHMFYIDKYSGKLYVKEPTLDREDVDFYKLVIKGTDMAGAKNGLTGTGNVEVKVMDINDNIPTLEKTEYAGSVDENVADVIVMKIKALDDDLHHTDNWLTVFKIAKGNEDNIFSIETDKETNEGILKLIKPGVGVGLKPGVKPGPGKKPKPKPDAPAKSYPIKIAVNNVPEGPAFIPDTKKVPVSEDPKDAPEDGVLTVFAAVDPDTGKTAEDVSYAKAYDPDNWFTIDEETAEIKLIKAPDRESPFLVNGTYIAKILAITKDMPAKTATGTIAIEVTDSNDHCPTLTTTYNHLCTDVKTVYVTGFDEDVSPNGAPFTFRIITEGTNGKWEVEVINGESNVFCRVLIQKPTFFSDCAVQVMDSLLEYDYEGCGSTAGSVGCCSLLESDNNLQFLNDLGPKFKTLAEICSPPTPTPKLTRKVARAVKTTVKYDEPVVKSKMETKQTDIKTEEVMSSTNISKSSASNISTAFPQSKVTNISHSSNIIHSATLPRPAQTVILQQQPLYYTTRPVMQPMHYVVQPQLQNTVLLADGTQGANFPGLYVVGGSQSPSSGFVIQGIESPKTPTSPGSPVSPLLLPVGPGVSQGSVPRDGWKIIGPKPDGNYILVQEKSSPVEPGRVDPGSPQGNLPRGAILVKEAAPPQGVLGPAAQGSVFGILPGHTVATKGGVFKGQLDIDYGHVEKGPNKSLIMTNKQPVCY
uniref:Si:ch73-74h11.1 n=1 Tax=Labrus bergylta TaxID=56723 RepID=A0A3Q3GU10_9LABR